MFSDPDSLFARIRRSIIFALSVGGYATAYFSSADLIEKLKLSEDIQKYVAVAYILIFSLAILALLAYRFAISDRKEKFANITPTLHSCIGRCKDLMSELNAESARLDVLSRNDAERVLKSAQRRLREICDEVAQTFAMLTGTHCRASIKVITNDVAAKLYIVTLARDNLTYREHPFLDQLRWDQRVDPLDQNSEFLRLFDDKIPKYAFVSNDLAKERNFLCTSIQAYRLNQGRELKDRSWWERVQGDPWPLPYRSTITVAVRNTTDQLVPGEPSVVGFLAVDSESRNVFSERWDPHICSMIADALFHPINMLLGLMPEDSVDGLADAEIQSEDQAVIRPSEAAPASRRRSNGKRSRKAGR